MRDVVIIAPSIARRGALAGDGCLAVVALGLTGVSSVGPEIGGGHPITIPRGFGGGSDAIIIVVWVVVGRLAGGLVLAVIVAVVIVAVGRLAWR